MVRTAWSGRRGGSGPRHVLILIRRVAVRRLGGLDATASLGRLARLRLIFGSPIARLMAGFFAIETLGTLLAPTLIDDVPLFIVAILSLIHI